MLVDQRDQWSDPQAPTLYVIAPGLLVAAGWLGISATELTSFTIGNFFITLNNSSTNSDSRNDDSHVIATFFSAGTDTCEPPTALAVTTSSLAAISLIAASPLVLLPWRDEW